jgi:hypothetical protein
MACGNDKPAEKTTTQTERSAEHSADNKPKLNNSGQDFKTIFPQLKWLVGKWIVSGPAGGTIEQWRQQNDSTYTGKAFRIENGKDTVVLEYLKISRVGNEAWFIVSVGDGNQGKPVRYSIELATGNMMAAENGEQDFPQRILYTLDTPLQVTSIVEGYQNGQFVQYSIIMEREKPKVTTKGDAK